MAMMFANIDASFQAAHLALPFEAGMASLNWPLSALAAVCGGMDMVCCRF